MSVPITKATDAGDGTVFVEGILTNDNLDLDNQIIDRDFARKAVGDWFRDWGNIRQMHSASLAPAGKAVAMEERPEGFWIRTHVVEPGAVRLVKAGVYQAYSIGISNHRTVRDPVAKGGRVIDGIQSEASLVDFPANPTSKFMLAKRAADGHIEAVQKHVAVGLTKVATEPGTVDDEPVTVRPSDVAALLRKLRHPDLVKRDMDPDVGGGVDRDKIPAEDFAGADRSFPIVTPGDVSDAASSIGRAGDDNDSTGQLKANITRIAHRKGPQFVDELPESWKDGHTPNAVTKKAPACATCNDTKKIRQGHVDCPDCVQKAADPELAKGGRDCTSCGKTHDTDHDGNFCGKCGSKLPGRVEKGLPAHREPDGDEAGPDVDGDGDGHTADDEDGDGQDDRLKKSAAAATYHLTRLHDATCAAYADPDVLEAHPSLAKGIPEVVDAEVFAAALQKGLTAPAGEQVWSLASLADAYAFASTVAAADPELLEAAMGDLRKAFAEYYPDAHPSPQSMTPASFQRTYLRTGHATQSAQSGQHPRIPLASHVPDPADFRRPLLTTGREAASPSSLGKAAGNRTYYTTAAREHASGVLTSLHDYIVEQHPGVCPMHGPTPDGEPALAGANGSTLTRAAAATSTMDMQTTAVPTPVPAQRAADVVHKGLDEDELNARLADLLKTHTAQFNEALETLGKRLEDLESAPDPATAGYRGSASNATLKTATNPAGRDMAEETERVVGLVKRAKSRDTTLAQPAIEQLIKAVGVDGTAELLK